MGLGPVREGLGRRAQSTPRASVGFPLGPQRGGGPYPVVPGEVSAPKGGVRPMVRDETILLLIEDDVDDELLTRRTVKKSNVCNDVVVARDGAEALDYLFATGEHEGRDPGVIPQVILLDLNLPKVDGLEVLRRIRGDERTRLLPVVILTSSSKQEDVIDGYSLEANSYVQKPVDVARFHAAVVDLGMYWMVMNETPSSG
jgi:two-component system, response regulator